MVKLDRLHKQEIPVYYFQFLVTPGYVMYMYNHHNYAAVLGRNRTFSIVYFERITTFEAL